MVSELDALSLWGPMPCTAGSSKLIVAEMYLEGVCRDYILCIFSNSPLVDDASIIAEMYLEGFAATVFCVFVFEFTIGR